MTTTVCLSYYDLRLFRSCLLPLDPPSLLATTNCVMNVVGYEVANIVGISSSICHHSFVSCLSGMTHRVSVGYGQG